MKLSVHDKPNARKTAVLRALAAHFGVPRSRVRLLSGATFNHKIVEVLGL